MSRNFNLLKGFLSALQAQIVSMGLFTSECCQLSLFEDGQLDEQYPQGSPILEIIPQDFGSLGWDDGGGIYDTALRGDIVFRILVMNVLDTIQTDVTVMTSTDKTLGIYELVDQLIAQIQMLDICDNNGNTYLVEPMRIAKGQGISKPVRNEKHPEWVIVKIKMETTICQNITNVS